MPVLMVKHRVANFESWKKLFDSMQPTRAKHGWISDLVLRDATDPNLVTIINRVKDLAGAKAYGNSPELREAMARGGVQGAPEIAMLDESAEHTY